MKQDRTVIFKVNNRLFEFLEAQARERNTTKSALIKAIIKKQLGFKDEII